MCCQPCTVARQQAAKLLNVGGRRRHRFTASRAPATHLFAVAMATCCWRAQKHRRVDLSRAGRRLPFFLFPATAVPLGPPAKFAMAAPPPPYSSRLKLHLALAHLLDPLAPLLAAKFGRARRVRRGGPPWLPWTAPPWPAFSDASLAPSFSVLVLL